MKTKRAARTVIVDENGLIALIDVRDGEYYKIPGGGIEAEESERTAARREALEEAGCKINIIRKIGEQQFVDDDPERGETMHHSVCFLAKKTSQHETSFDDWEQSNDMKLIWVDFETAKKLFASGKPVGNFCTSIHNRDFEFVLKGMEIYRQI
ncbi:MAG: NUDIX domain-containing protein [Candidatus Saccharibacteria bacterium]